MQISQNVLDTLTQIHSLWWSKLDLYSRLFPPLPFLSHKWSTGHTHTKNSSNSCFCLPSRFCITEHIQKIIKLFTILEYIFSCDNEQDIPDLISFISSLLHFCVQDCKFCWICLARSDSLPQLLMKTKIVAEAYSLSGIQHKSMMRQKTLRYATPKERTIYSRGPCKHHKIHCHVFSKEQRKHLSGAQSVQQQRGRTRLPTKQASYISRTRRADWPRNEDLM